MKYWNLKFLKYTMHSFASLFLAYFSVYLVCVGHSAIWISVDKSTEFQLQWSATGNHELDISVKAAGPSSVMKLVSVYKRGPFDYVYGEAVFENVDGGIDTALDAPRSGFYERTFGDGLFWSMRDYAFSLNLAWKFGSLPKWKRHVFLLDTDGKVRASSHVRLVAPREGLNVKSVKVGNENLRIVEGWKGLPARKPVILIGGSGHQDLDWKAFWLAEHGVTSALISINPDLTTDCFHNADPNILNQKIDALREYAQATDIVVVGLSAGAGAALLAQTLESDPFRLTFAISPALFHFNGAKGSFCARPAPSWKNHDTYRNFYGSGLVGAWTYLQVRWGFKHQRDAILGWLPNLDKDELSELRLIETIPEGAIAYFGLEDTQLPQKFTSVELCDGEPHKCRIYEFSGHSLLYDGHTVIGCNFAMEKQSKFCSATKRTQIEIAADILSATRK